MTNKLKALIATTATILLFAPFIADAAEVKSQNNIYVPAGETIDGNLYAAGNNITIDGEIKGDLIAAAQTITVNGRLDGDLIAAAQTITINGEINGNVRIAANSASLNGVVARNVNFIGNSIALGKNARVGWDLLSAAMNTDIMGVIDGNVYGEGDNIILSGKIGKNFSFLSDNRNRNITLAPQATINGNLTYGEGTNINIQDGASVAGEVNPVKQESKSGSKAMNKLWSIIYSIFAAIVIGLVIIKPGRKIALGMNNIIRQQPGMVFVWGLLTFLVVPMGALILIFTIIGAPLAIILLGLWLMMLWIGKIITAIFVGQTLVARFSRGEENSKTLTVGLMIGVIILWLLFAIPFVGWLISLAATCLGTGALILLFTSRNS
ncbi:MAG: polymer-forming cytoskeletal protein [bacterium]|nr:polymer-forming cytoskeletal protein [bacterium]